LGSVYAQVGIPAQAATGYGIQIKEDATEIKSHCSDAVHGRKSRYTAIHWGYNWGYTVDFIFQMIHLLSTYYPILIQSCYHF